MAALVESISDVSVASSYGGEWRHLKKDGTFITAAVYSSPTTFDGKEARMALAVDLTERTESERKVRESEANLALAQQVAGVGSWEYQCTADGQVDEGKLHWSQEAYRQFGLSSDGFQISNEAFFQMVHPDDRAFVSDRFDAFKEGREPFDYDYRIIRPDGTERIIDAIAGKIFDPGPGKPLKVVGTVLDITQRRAVEKQLRETEEKYRSIFDNALEGIFQSTPEGVFISANPAFARMLGFASSEELIRERNDIKSRLCRAGEAAGVQAAARQGRRRQRLRIRSEAQRREHDLAFRERSRRPRRRRQRSLLRRESQDITKRARAELVLRESEEYLRLVIAASNDGIWEYDFPSDALTWSDRVYEMFLLDRNSFTPTLDSFTALLHPDDRATFQKTVREQMTSGARYEAHIRILRGDGSYGHFLRRGRVRPSSTPTANRLEWSALSPT